MLCPTPNLTTCLHNNVRQDRTAWKMKMGTYHAVMWGEMALSHPVPFCLTTCSPLYQKGLSIPLPCHPYIGPTSVTMAAWLPFVDSSGKRLMQATGQEIQGSGYLEQRLVGQSTES